MKYIYSIIIALILIISHVATINAATYAQSWVSTTTSPTSAVMPNKRLAPVQATYFIATSTTATSTFLGKLGLGTSTPASNFDVYGSVGIKSDSISATTTLGSSHASIFATTSVNAVGINLPTIASSCGRVYTINKINEGGQFLTIDPSGSELIDGSSTETFIAQGSITIQANCGNSTWSIISEYKPSQKYFISVKEFGAIPDDGISDTNAIQSAIEYAKTLHASTTVLLQEGQYDISRTSLLGVAPSNNAGIILRSGVRLMGASRQGTILKLTDGQDTIGSTPVIFTVAGSYDVSVERLSVDGNRINNDMTAAGESECINFKSSSYVWVQDVNAYNCSADGIDMDAGDHIYIQNFNLHDIGGNGIHIAGAGPTDVIVSDGFVTSSALARINVAGIVRSAAAGIDSYSGSRQLISNVIFFDNARNFVQTNSSYVTLQNSLLSFHNGNEYNILIGNNGGSVGGGSDILIKNNFIQGPYNTGASTSTILVEGAVHDVNFENNWISGGRAIQLNNDDVNITGGHIDSQDNGVYITGGTNITIKGVNFEDNTSLSHIRALAGTNIDIIGNRFKASGSSSVDARTAATGGRIMNNSFLGTSANNITLFTGESGWTVQGNVMAGDLGVYDDSNKVIDNTMRNLVISGSAATGNTFMRNYISGTVSILSTAATSSQTWINNYTPGATALPNYLGDNNVGIGTTSPYARLSVVGQVVGSYFTATTSTVSTFPYASTTALSADTICISTDCRTSWPASGGGSGGGSWSTTTSTVSGRLINYPNNTTDVVAIGSNSTTTSEFWFDPNTKQAKFLSTDAGGDNTTDSTARLTLNSYQKAQSPNNFGELIRLESSSSTSKQMIAWYDATTTPKLLKAWIGWHYGANDPSDTLNPHDHLSIETPDAAGLLQTRMEFQTANADTTGINTFNSNFTVIQGTSGVTALPGSTGAFSIYSAGTDRDKTLRWSFQKNGTTEAGSDVGSDFQISSFNDAGSFTRTPFFIKRSSGDVGIGSTSPFARLGVELATNGTGILVQNTTGGGNTAANFLAKAQTSTSRAFQAGLQSDSTNRYSIDVAGLTEWGPGGSTARDTNLFRNSANVLRTNDTLIVDGNVGIGTTSPYATLSVVGPVVAEYFTGTSTTATSTFAGGLNIHGNTLIVDSSSNHVFIGTSTGSAPLSIGAQTNGEGLLVTGNQTGMTSFKSIARFQLASTSPIVQIGHSLTGGTLATSLGIGDDAFKGFSGEFYGGLDIAYGGSPATLLLGAENNKTTRTNLTTKTFRIAGAPYNTAQNVTGVLVANNGVSSNVLSWGGGSSVVQGATQQDFYSIPTINTAGIARLSIYGNGSIGINDTTPSHQLDINLPVDATAKVLSFDTIKATNTATSTTASLDKAGVEIVSTGAWSGTNARNIGVYVSSVTGGTYNYDAIFNGGGNVGIGTSSPYAKLSVVGQVVGSYFTATSTTLASSFVNSSTTLASFGYASSTEMYVRGKHILGTYDKSIVIASTTPDSNYRSFSTATSTFVIWNPKDAVAIQNLYCKTTNGTVTAEIGNGSATTTAICTTSGLDVSSSVTVSARTNVVLNLGNIGSSANSVTVTGTFYNQ